MSLATNSVGAYGERVALRYLVDQGMVLVARNWRCAVGEIDAIMKDGPAIVFVEVKTRRGLQFGTPAEALIPRKVSRLRRLAGVWLAESRLRPSDVRFDVVSVQAHSSGAATVEHLRGAF
jgi:putative endonuclease